MHLKISHHWYKVSKIFFKLTNWTTLAKQEGECIFWYIGKWIINPYTISVFLYIGIKNLNIIHIVTLPS